MLEAAVLGGHLEGRRARAQHGLDQRLEQIGGLRDFVDLGNLRPSHLGEQRILHHEADQQVGQDVDEDLFGLDDENLEAEEPGRTAG